MFLKGVQKVTLSALVSVWVMATPSLGLAAQAAEQKDKSEQKTKTPTKEELFSQEYVRKLSEAYGHFIQKSLENPVLKLDFTSVIKGMEDAKSGKPSPMTEQEYEDTINLVQEYAYQEMADRNLKEADDFMKKNAKLDGVVELEPGKLQYKIVSQGKGSQVVTDDTVPFINYTGKYLNGSVFGSSEENGGPISISLNQTIPGFRKAVLGMRQGEKRQIFIHPDLGYGTSGQLSPNAMLIFEVEVADVKPKPEETSKDNQTDDDSLAALTYGPDQIPDDEAQEEDEEGDFAEADDDQE